MVMMNLTTREVAETRKTRRRTARLVVAARDDDVEEILHPHLHHQHPLRHQVRILRDPLPERSKRPWSVLGLVILRPKSLIGSLYLSSLNPKIIGIGESE